MKWCAAHGQRVHRGLHRLCARLCVPERRRPQPERATPQHPRTRLPAGSVGFRPGTFSGVYPQASPGGWQIHWHHACAMWDITRAQPALLQPGYRVRFVDIATKNI